jgi:hypothetical protein
MLLPTEKSVALSEAVRVEALRKATSARDRANTRLKHSTATTASPPAAQELSKCVVFLDDGIQMPREWLATLSKYRGRMTREAWAASFFVALNPSTPANPLITWAAALAGSWVVSPGCFMGGVGASIKYKPAIFTKRQVWASESFRADNSDHWLALLEILNSFPTTHSWKIVGNAEQWACVRAHAEKAKRPTEVIALVSTPEACALGKAGAFDLVNATKFFACNIDKNRRSIGLLHM